MFGVVITSRPNNQVAETIEHIDGLPTRRDADNFAHKWCQEAPSNRTALVYEMEKPAPKEPPLFTYSTGPAGATLNLTPQQLLDKVDTLCTKLDTLKRFICDRCAERLGMTLDGILTKRDVDDVLKEIETDILGDE